MTDPTKMWLIENYDRAPVLARKDISEPFVGLVFPYLSKFGGIPISIREGDDLYERKHVVPIPESMIATDLYNNALWIGVGEGRALLLPWKLVPHPAPPDPGQATKMNEMRL